MAYVQLSRKLGSDQPFYGLQSVGIDGRPPDTSVQQMAYRYVEAVREFYPEGPVCLGGWSFGGIVALEMAQLLKGQGRQVPLLALLDSGVPTVGMSRHGDHASLLASFLMQLGDAMPGGARVHYNALKGLALHQQWRYVCDRARNIDVLPPHPDVSRIARLASVYETNVRAMQAYRPSNYAGRVVLFRADDRRVEEREGEPTAGWADIVAEPGTLQTFTVGGDHYSMMREPVVDGLAAHLGECLDEACSPTV